MTKLLEQVIEEFKKLPDKEQDVMAQRLLLALDEHNWDLLFARPDSEKFLEELADEIRADIKSGQTKLLDLDKLCLPNPL